MKNSIKYKGIYIFTYASIGVLCPLIGQYLGSIGFSGTQIGIVTATSTAVSIFAAGFWGKQFSNSANGKIVVAMLCLLAAAVAIGNIYIKSFAIFTLTYSVMYFFQGPIMGLIDAMVLSDDQNFAPIRLCGALGYAISVFIGGRIGEAYGLDKIFVIYGVTYLIGGILIMSLKKPKGEEKFDRGMLKENNERKVGFSELLKEGKAVKLIICGIFIFGTNVANNTYFGFLFEDGGGTVAGLGTVFLLMVGSEAPFMAIAPKMAEKISSEKLIALAMIISAARFAWYGMGPSHTELTIMFFLQGMVNGVLLVEYIKYLSSIIDAKLIGIAVSAFYGVSSSFGTIICNFLGGIAMDSFGSTGVYILFAVFNVVGILLYFSFGLQKKRQLEEI